MDTNVVLYLLNGDDTLASLIDGKQIYISFITELELLGYLGISEQEMLEIRQFIKDCTVINITEQIKEKAIEIRQKKKIKLPDSIIAATSQYLNIPLITSDVHFKSIDAISTIIYEL